MKKNTVILILLLLPLYMRAQNNAEVVNITEVGKKSKQLSFDDGKAIVDINSSLDIDIRRTALTRLLSTNVVQDAEVTRQIDLIEKILTVQKEISKLLAPEVLAANEPAKALEYYNLSRKFYALIKDEPGIRARINDFFKEAIAAGKMPQLYVMEQMPALADSLVQAIQSSEKMKNVNIKLVATLNTKGEPNRPVHIENFDNYTEGEYYEVPRWVTTFSEENIKQFDAMAKTTAVINSMVDKGFANAKEVIKDELKSPDCFENLHRDVKTLIDNPGAVFGAEKDIAVSHLIAFEAKITELQRSLNALNNVAQSQDKNALQLFNNVSEQFLQLTQSLPQEVTNLKNSLIPALAGNAALAGIYNQYNTCKGKLDEDIATVTNVVTVVKSFLLGFKKTTDAVEQITGNSLAFTIDQLPTYGSINLKTTGSRHNGDELTIKLVYQTKADVEAHRKGTVIKQYPIELQQVSFHSVANISAIAARSIAKGAQPAIGDKIQFAPSGSLLLKFGSRSSRLWNDISPGIGINLSTPDFDLDGAPDMAYGGVISLFKEVLSTGIAYNTKTDTPFWFFGVSLPFASLGLTGKVDTK